MAFPTELIEDHPGNPHLRVIRAQAMHEGANAGRSQAQKTRTLLLAKRQQ